MVMTDLPNMPAGDVLGHHGQIRQVRRTLRVPKHDLKVKQVLQWTWHRIRATGRFDDERYRPR